MSKSKAQKQQQTADAAASQSLSATDALPDWFPQWARQMIEAYQSGATSMFILHGNVHDLIHCPGADDDDFCNLVEFLGANIFGSWDIVLRHDLSNGLRALSGSDAERHQEMMRHLSGILGHYNTWSKGPDDVLSVVDQLLERNLLADSEKRKDYGLVFEYAQYLMPRAEVESLSGTRGARLVRFLQWAQNPYLKKVNCAFCLIVDNLSELNDRVIQNPHVSTIEVPLPDEAQRRNFINKFAPEKKLKKLTEFTAAQLATMSNGLNLTNINMLLSQARRTKIPVDASRFKSLKKTAIERSCHGLLEFVEPDHTLDLVVGHDAAKSRLREDAEFLMSGRSDAAPMGYLFCGPVGTGKTFMAECFAGSIGIPAVKLRNFRSKYVGETEANLEKVLNVLRSLGPVVVIIDEADAALGNRTSGGDSGTSSRVFSMIASQMGNTDYRGKIIWMLLTCRPDLLPIDLKRQGRAEVHVPLFYPRSKAEMEKMFVVMARKNDMKISPDCLPKFDEQLSLSGADIESVVLTAKRSALSQGRQEIEQKDLQTALDQFIPSAQGLEKTMQEIAGVLECTQRDFLTDAWRQAVEQPNGRSELQDKLVKLKRLIDEQ